MTWICELVLASLLGALILLVAVLRVVHDPRHGRIRAGCDLDEVEPLLEREVERFLRLRDPDLASVLVHETDARDADLLVDALLPLARDGPVARLAGDDAVSKGLHQALAPSLERQNRCKQRLLLPSDLRLG